MLNKMKNTVLVMLFISSLFLVPMLSDSAMAGIDSTPINQIVDESYPSSYIPRNIRVAVYDEQNSTHPDYDYGGMVSTNISVLMTTLESVGYQVTALDVQDISAHKLKSADYDVFVIFDTSPRENITWLVKEYWLGGGSILSIDGAINYINYFGIMCPDFEGTNNYGVDWDYIWSENQTVETRHPVSQAYQIDEIITLEFDWALYNRAALTGSSTGDEYTFISHIQGNTAWVSTVARDPKDQGGKVVQLFGDQSKLPPTNLLRDAIDWLTPRPKGRILIDYTNFPYYGVDAGDPTGYTAQGRYAQLRNLWVNHTFTVDKLYSEDTTELTSSILSKYDMLFINTPDENYTASEITAIQNWIASGGGLLILGDSSGFITRNARINDILDGYDLSISGINYHTNQFIADNKTFHPINELVTTLTFQGGCYVNTTGSAVSIWRDDYGEVAAIQEVGAGRIFLASDINFLGNYILYDDNAHFGLNIANWLCSGGADILVYMDGVASFGSDWNYYRAPLTLALNELGVNYYMSNERDYFNESLKLYSWELVIIDANSNAPATSHPLIIEHLESGGKVIWRDFMFRYPSYDNTWNYLGFSGLDDRITAGPPSVYLWEPAHSLFNIPVDYNAANISASTNILSTDFTNVTVLSNATGIAGVTLSYNENQSAIILGVQNRAICNMFAISEYLDDTDDSTYVDAYEIWLNEIAYMLKPTISHPSDIEYTEGETGNSITWTPLSELPSYYQIRRNGSLVYSHSWSGSLVNYNVDGLTNGTYIFRLTVFDLSGYSVYDEVTVTVSAVIPTTTTGGGGLPLDPTLLLIVGAAALVVIIILVVAMKKRPAK
ncbi:MAG: hypothetical protein JW779_02315 [Candidatus Thorarchaeota archaeon]|nr:hypothetical protein [Candidatus Thorarchaeota archaeon]